MEVSMDTTTSTTVGVSHIPHQPLTTPPDEDPRKRSLDHGDGGHVTDSGPGSEMKPSNQPSHHNDAISNPIAGNFDAKPDNAAVRVEVQIPAFNGHDYSPLNPIPSPNLGTVQNGNEGDAPPAKKRKLSPASKEAREQEKLLKQQEKEAKERQRVEEKAKKEEERRVKEEEKKKRDAEREEERKRKEEKKRAKHEEKAARDEEKRKKEEEKSKKERAQTRLNCFFAKPKLPQQSPKKPAGSQNDSANDTSIISDYQRQFPDFFLQSNTRLAPMHRFERDPKALKHMRAMVDTFLKSADGSAQEPLTFRPSELFRIIPYKRGRGRQIASVKDILSKLQSREGSLDADGPSETSDKLQDMLRKIPMKSLKFGEDVRPPYQGTYSKPLPESSVSKLSRNPFYRGLPETDYDYDSEAEWEDPGEGEDLDSEEEEDVSEEGDDDMDGFLDDEDDHPVDGKRRLIVGDMEPACTGIRWQEDGVDPELQVYRAATISDSVTFPIDPFSTAYWTAKDSDTGRQRPDLNNTLSTILGASKQAGPDQLPGKAKRPFPPEHLAEFKQVVNGSDLTKTGVIEVLKKRFPKVSKDVLKGTLDSVAERVGQKEADKRLPTGILRLDCPWRWPGDVHGKMFHAHYRGSVSVVSPQSALPPLCDPSSEAPLDDKPGMPSSVSFEDFAIRFRQNQQKRTQRKALERRLHATKVSVGISARLVRVGTAVQRGLVDCLKHDDKINFVSLYHTLYEIQESCDTTLRRQLFYQDPSSLDDQAPSLEQSEANHSRGSDFFHQLSPQSQSDLNEILQLVRSEPLFLFERLRRLPPAQLAGLTAPPDASDSIFPSSRLSQFSSSRRSPSASIPHKDHAFAFERTDPLSALLFNVFAAPVDSDAPEARLRLDVWSSVCALLISHGGSRFYPLIGHILSSWAMCSNWKARSRFELYLMDILQSGAFLLEHIDTPPGSPYNHEALDPLRTDVAEEFFASAVDSLFNLLDDPEAGFPHAVTEFGSAVFRKLVDREQRSRFLEFFFVQWFFAKFLYGALTYPESHGLLLDFHIRKDAREKLLGQVALQAYSQVFAQLRSMPQFATASPAASHNIRNIISRFMTTAGDDILSEGNVNTNPSHLSANGQCSPAVFLMLSSSDILTILNTVFPRSQSVCSSPALSSGLSASPVFSSPERFVEPGSLRPRIDVSSMQSFNMKPTLSAEMNFLSFSENCLSRNAERIRFELFDLCETGRSNLEHPSSEDWTIFSIAEDGRSLVCNPFSDDQSAASENASVDAESALGIEDNNEALQTAIVKLVKENPTGDPLDGGLSQTGEQGRLSLKQRFDRARMQCHHDSDFIGAHYWWNASKQLLRSANGSTYHDDSWILEPMRSSCTRSLSLSLSVIERCESDFVTLDRTMHRLQGEVKEIMATVSKLRNKMWFLTDVRNSMRYEDAKNVALALKTMIYSAYLQEQAPDERRSRGGRSLGGSLLQKPELQVMNVMKAASSQGGPNKLSDDQVDLTRKWLSHNNIDNFCKGEERIHRFCYEVKTSINRLVGETMAEAPVLWASELFQKERAKYEGHARSFLGLSGASSRPFSAAGDDVSSYTPSLRASDALSRYSQDIPSLARKSSFQSMMSDRWRSSRDYSADTLSVGDSPGRAASTSTGDSCSTFWSTPHQPAYYAASASSRYSRPPSMFSDTPPQPQRRNDRKTHGKQVFLDELRQALTSLLLSDLGSPVWSCGSETDAWFSSALDQKRIRAQMEKSARIQRFYDEYDERTSRQATRVTGGRRSRSLEPPKRDAESASVATSEQALESVNGFSYGAVFRRLIEVFSRHGNPFVKLKALRDLRALVIASLNSRDTSPLSNVFTQDTAPNTGSLRRRRSSFPGRARHTPEKPILRTPTSAESVVSDYQPPEYSLPTDSQVVDALKRLLLEIKPKTLFRDLQFISAFVSSDKLNKTDSGTAFVQFGLAALGLKDEVCNSMVEIADAIVSQELSRRHPPLGYDMNPHHGRAIEDAAGMWIITAKEGNPVAQRELAILYLTHPELLPRVTLPLTLPRDTFKAEMMYRRDKDSKTDPQSMCLALHWMQLSANGGDELARNRLREREEFDSIA